MDGIYVISGAKEIQESGLLVPSFQGGATSKKWIVRETRPEMIHSRFPKTDIPTQNNIELSYMLIETILAIVQLSLLSQKIRPDIIQNVVRRNILASGISPGERLPSSKSQSMGEGEGEDRESSDYTKVFQLAKRYALAREYRKDKNPLAYNAIFDVGDIYSDIVSFITESNRKQKSSEESGGKGEYDTMGDAESESPFHISLSVILNSFSICRSNRRTMTLLRLLEKKRDGGVGILTRRIIQILESKPMVEWLSANPSQGGRIVSLLRGMGGLSDDISKTSPGGIMAQLMKKNIENVINHMKIVCSDNPQFSLSVSEPVMLYEAPKDTNTIVLTEKYSPEIRVAIRRIFDKFRDEEIRMQSEILSAFMKLFVFSKTPIKDTLSIGFSYKKDGKDEVEYLSIRPNITNASSPMGAIVTCFIDMTSAYSSYVMRTYKLIETTFTKTTRVV
jgi:hypothetical protein